MRVFLPSSLLTLTTPHLLLSPSLLAGVKRVMSADLCVLFHRPITSPRGGFACASFTSESLPQRCSDVLGCLLKKLPGDCCHRWRRPIVPSVLMDHAQDAGLQSRVLRAGRGRGWWWGREGQLHAGEGAMIALHLHKYNSPLGHERQTHAGQK